MKGITKIIDFGNLNDAGLELKAELIVEAMTRNVYFPDPIPSIADINASVKAFDIAIMRVKEGNKWIVSHAT